VWNQVCNVINKPEILIVQARTMVDELSNSALTYSADRERIEKELDTLTINRQWVITQARKGSISEQDMDRQLSEMSLQEASLKQELASIRETIDARSMNDWELRVRQYLSDMQEGILGLSVTPETPDDEQTICKLKRQAIETLVEKVVVDRNRQFTVTIRLNLLSILGNASGNGGTNGDSSHWPHGNASTDSESSGNKFALKARMGLVRVSAIWQD
jgi:hypothetical protein